jgi:hypothetical protein
MRVGWASLILVLAAGMVVLLTGWLAAGSRYEVIRGQAEQRMQHVQTTVSHVLPFPWGQ